MQNELEVKILNAVEQAKSFEITNNKQYEVVGNYLLGLKALRKEVDSGYDTIIKKAHEAHKEALAQKKKITDPIDNAEKILKPKIAGYLEECENKRRLEQLRAEAEEKKRIESEAIAAASLAESNAEAAQILEQAVTQKPVVFVPKVESKIQGISQRKVWKWKLENVKNMSNNFLIPDEQKISSLVKSLGKSAESIVGGITTYEETIISARS